MDRMQPENPKVFPDGSITGAMTTDDKALCERLRTFGAWAEVADRHRIVRDAADRIEALSAEVEHQKSLVRKVQASARTLDATRTEIYDHYVKNSAINHEAVATLDSEREANARLTEELAASESRNAKLVEALEKAAIRLAHLGGQIEAGHGISGTLRADQAMKARHMSAEARAALEEAKQ